MKLRDIGHPDPAASVDATVGYTLPAPFRALLERLGEIARTNEPDANLWDELGLAELNTKPVRYPSTPPEMFIFGWMGVDGVHYGHLNRAPEREWPDLPFVHFDPMEDGPDLVGATASETIARLLADQISSHMLFATSGGDEDDVRKADRVRRIARALGFGDLADAEAGAHIEAQEMLEETGEIEREDLLDAALASLDDELPDAIPVAVPEGWLYVPTLDGVGVLAPATAFHATPDGFPLVERRGADAAQILAEARRHRERHPASALVHYKNHFRLTRANDATAVREMANCYARLGRPQLGAHALRSAELPAEAEALLRAR